MNKFLFSVKRSYSTNVSKMEKINNGRTENTTFNGYPIIEKDIVGFNFKDRVKILLFGKIKVDITINNIPQ